MELRVRRRILVSFIILCLVTVGIAGEHPISDGWNVVPTREERLRGLAEVWGMVYYFHPALADPQKQAAWESELLVAIPEVEAAETLDEYAMALQRMIAKLGDGGTTILFPGEANESDELASTKLPIRLAVVEGQVVITAIDASAQGAEALEVGMVLVSIDGILADDYLSQWLPVASGRTEKLRCAWVFDRLLSGAPGSIALLVVRNADDQEMAVEFGRPSIEYWHRPEPKMTLDTITEECYAHISLSSVLVVLDRTPGITSLYELADRFYEVIAEAEYEGVILDLRAGAEEFGSSFYVDIPIPNILAYFVGETEATSAGYGQRIHEGLKDPTHTMLSHPYGENWGIRPGVQFGSPQGTVDGSPLVILVDQGSYPSLAEYLIPLQASGRAAVIGEQGVEPVRKSYSCSLPGGLGFQLRLSLPWDVDEGRVALPVIDVSPSLSDLRSGRDPALETAVDILENWQDRASLALPDALGDAISLSAQDADSQRSLTRAERLLGLFKIWNAIRYFYPFPEMIEGDWDDILSEFIPRVTEVLGDREYYHELQHLLASLNDGHAYVGIGFPSQWRPPIEIKEIEGQAVIVAIEAGQPLYPDLASLKVGMIISEVNGQSVDDHIDTLVKWVPGATEQHRRLIAFDQLLAGKQGTNVLMRVEDENDLSSSRKVALMRTSYPTNDSSASPISWLCDDICYVNLTTIDYPGFAKATDELRSASGLILDLRGYPSEVGAGMIHDFVFDGDENVAWTHLPLVSSPDSYTQTWKIDANRTDEGSIVAYDGEVVVLTDARAISASEWLLLGLQLSNRLLIVGGFTAGTTGAITYVEIPGPAYAGFTGVKVMRGDGTPFQGIGIIPDVIVHPTIQGIREGRDEIFEKGLEVLQELIATRQAED